MDRDILKLGKLKIWLQQGYIAFLNEKIRWRFLGMLQFLKITEYHSKHKPQASSILDMAKNHLRICRQDFQHILRLAGCCRFAAKLAFCVFY